MTAFKGYYKRKLTELFTKKLIGKVPRKHIEWFGEIAEVNYEEFK
jgi:hypothetical protein